MSEAFQKQSRFLSFILRHRPEAAGLKLDKDGWAVVAEIIANTDITVNILYEIVRTDSKGRYSLNEGLTKNSCKSRPQHEHGRFEIPARCSTASVIPRN